MLDERWTKAHISLQVEKKTIHKSYIILLSTIGYHDNFYSLCMNSVALRSSHMHLFNIQRPMSRWHRITAITIFKRFTHCIYAVMFRIKYTVTSSVYQCQYVIWWKIVHMKHTTVITQLHAYIQLFKFFYLLRKMFFLSRCSSMQS